MSEILRRGQRIDLPAAALRSLVVRVEAGCADAGDIDFSLVALDANRRLVDDGWFVFYNQRSAPGDVVALASQGDHSRRVHELRLDLGALPAWTRTLVLVLSRDAPHTMHRLTTCSVDVRAPGAISWRFDIECGSQERHHMLVAAEIYRRPDSRPDQWRLWCRADGPPETTLESWFKALQDEAGPGFEPPGPQERPAAPSGAGGPQPPASPLVLAPEPPPATPGTETLLRQPEPPRPSLIDEGRKVVQKVQGIIGSLLPSADGVPHDTAVAEPTSTPVSRATPPADAVPPHSPPPSLPAAAGTDASSERPSLPPPRTPAGPPPPRIDPPTVRGPFGSRAFRTGDYVLPTATASVNVWVDQARVEADRVRLLPTPDGGAVRVRVQGPDVPAGAIVRIDFQDPVE